MREEFYVLLYEFHIIASFSAKRYNTYKVLDVNQTQTRLRGARSRSRDRDPRSLFFLFLFFFFQFSQQRKKRVLTEARTARMIRQDNLIAELDMQKFCYLLNVILSTVPNKDVLWKARKFGHSLLFWDVAPFFSRDLDAIVLRTSWSTTLIMCCPLIATLYVYFFLWNFFRYYVLRFQYYQMC